MLDNRNMSSIVTMKVVGLPPAKSEAKSMLSAGHPHLSRVRALLECVNDELSIGQAVGFGTQLVGLELVLRTPADPPSDSTNYLGGVADVLEAKWRRGPSHTEREPARLTRRANLASPRGAGSPVWAGLPCADAQRGLALAMACSRC